MSLVRNLTRRARAHTRGEETLPRSCSVRYAPGTINRAKISLPTELLSTTNVDALNAPDIPKTFAPSSGASSSSDSVHSDFDKSFLGTDTSSNSDHSPMTPSTPVSDTDSKDFFSPKIASSSSVPTLTAEPTPVIPKRAPSHSKQAHVELSRERSSQRSLSPPPTTLVEPASVRDTASFFPSPAPRATQSMDKSAHPFGRELAKVDEVAETFGIASSGIVLDEEEQEMMSKGLRKFTVNDYIAELTGMTGGIYEDKIVINPWI